TDGRGSRRSRRAAGRSDARMRAGRSSAASAGAGLLLRGLGAGGGEELVEPVGWEQLPGDLADAVVELPEPVDVTGDPPGDVAGGVAGDVGAEPSRDRVGGGLGDGLAVGPVVGVVASVPGLVGGDQFRVLAV